MLIVREVVTLRVCQYGFAPFNSQRSGWFVVAQQGVQPSWGTHRVFEHASGLSLVPLTRAVGRLTETFDAFQKNLIYQCEREMYICPPKQINNSLACGF